MIHFHLGRFFGVVKDTYGLALAEDQGLRLAFHSEDEEEVDIMDTQVDEVVIPWNMIRAVTTRKGLFESDVEVHLSKLFVHKDLPLEKGQILTLDIRKKERKMIPPFIKTCQSRLAGKGKGKDDIDSILDDTRDFLNDL